MDKINFENLPSTNTPLDADTLNGMQSNIEKSVVAIGETQPSTSENVWIKKGKNLFNKNNVLNGYRFGSDGALFADSSYSASDFIKVSNSTQYTISWNIETRECVCYYDGNKTFISRNVSEKPFTTPANCKYIRASVSNSSVNSAQIEQGSQTTTYEPYVDKEILVKNNNGVFEEFYNEGKNVIEKINNSNGTALLFDDGTMICYGNVYSTNISWSTWGSIYSASMSYTFPIEFVALPAVFCSVAGGANTGNGWTGRPVHTTTGGSVEIYRPTSYGNTMSIDFMAIGNWK